MIEIIKMKYYLCIESRFFMEKRIRDNKRYEINLNILTILKLQKLVKDEKFYKKIKKLLT